MPPPSVVLVRLALIHLLIGTSLGTLLLIGKGAPDLAILSWRWRPAHVEMLLIGFTLQMALGVAFWILPRDADQPPPPQPAWFVACLLNAGVLLIASASLARSPWLPLAGRALEVLAIAAFAAHAWRRIRGVRLVDLSAGSPARSR